MKASDLFVRQLENEGVEYIFGLPGEENLDFLESLRKSKIKLVLTRHEQSAGFMAATYGRLTGKVGVVLSTLGPGATNLVNAAAYAQLGGFPVLFITGQKPIKNGKQGLFQIVDVSEVFRPVTKFTTRIEQAEMIPRVIRKAFAEALSPRFGAVHLELSEDVARKEVSAKKVKANKQPRLRASEAEINMAAKLINSSKSPLILLGAGTQNLDLSKALQRFINKTKIPFVTTNLGKGSVDELGEYYLGTTAFSENDYIHFAVSRADVIICFGHDPIAKPPFLPDYERQVIIHVNQFLASYPKIYEPKCQIVGEITDATARLGVMIVPQSHWDFDYFWKIKKLVAKRVADRSDSKAFPILPQRLVSEIRQALPNDGILSLDNGMYKLWFSRGYRAFLPNTFLMDDTLATMGAGLPAAMTAAILYPSKKIVAVVGDGGFMMSSYELELAVRLKLNLTVVVVNDGAYGMIKWKQKDMGFGNFGLSYNNPDFVKYAQSFGAKGHRVGSVSQLRSLLKTAISAPGVNLVDVPIDYSENDRVFSRELKNMICP